jgi:hypothetical protein
VRRRPDAFPIDIGQSPAGIGKLFRDGAVRGDGFELRHDIVERRISRHRRRQRGDQNLARD